MFSRPSCSSISLATVTPSLVMVLSDQADAILETARALVALDRRDLDAAWHQTHTALEALPRP
jgi:hypothetical protein